MSFPGAITARTSSLRIGIGQHTYCGAFSEESDLSVFFQLCSRQASPDNEKVPHILWFFFFTVYWGFLKGLNPAQPSEAGSQRSCLFYTFWTVIIESPDHPFLKSRRNPQLRPFCSFKGFYSQIGPSKVPTLTEWGMIILTVLIGIGSVYLLGRRKLEV